MEKKVSGSALFMYVVILLCILLTVAAFSLYYTEIWAHAAVLWTGITTFTILYHFGGRILLGKLTVLFPPSYHCFWFREKRFEKKLYKLLRVRKWKEKVLTFDPDAFDLSKRTYEELAFSMTKAETDHWINELLSLTTLIFPLLWGHFPLFFGVTVVAMLFDAQFIVVQRYNRPILLRVIARKKEREEKKATLHT